MILRCLKTKSGPSGIVTLSVALPAGTSTRVMLAAVGQYGESEQVSL